MNEKNKVKFEFEDGRVVFVDKAKELEFLEENLGKLKKRKFKPRRKMLGDYEGINRPEEKF